MPGKLGAGLPRERRLRNRTDFRQVFRRGRRLDGPLFSLVALRNGRGYHRLGLAASRKVGGAVRRNRAKRLLREAFRRLAEQSLPGHDFVAIVKAGLADRTQGEIEREYQERVRRLGRAKPERSLPAVRH